MKITEISGMYSETATERDNLKNTSTVTVPVWLSVIIHNTADVFLTSSFHVFVSFLSSRIVGFKVLSQVMSTNFFGIFGVSGIFGVVCVCARARVHRLLPCCILQLCTYLPDHNTNKNDLPFLVRCWSLL